MKSKIKRRKGVSAHVFVPQYSRLALMLASATAPLSQDYRNLILRRMWAGYAALQAGATPAEEDWRVCTDCVNLLMTIIDDGNAQDAEGLLADALKSLAEAGMRYREGKTLRLDGAGLHAVQSILIDFERCMNGLSERYMKDVSNRTDRDIWNALHGKPRRPGLEVVAL